MIKKIKPSVLLFLVFVSIFFSEINKTKAQGHSVFTCNACHITHTADGTQLTNATENSLLCQSCHKNPGLAQNLAMPDAIIAVPGVGGTSHAWNKSAVNSTFETNLPANTEMADRIMSGNIVCSTCHDQHNSNSLTNYLRIDNTGDAICKECHTARNVGIYADNNLLNKGSHPVGVIYNSADARFLAIPSGSMILKDGNVECSSCHGIHGLTETTTADGYVLRQTNDNNLCTSCHTYSAHNGASCNTCHNPHNTDKTNIYLIQNNILTPNSGTKPVIFTAETGTNSFADGDATYNGICEVCHTSTTYHLNTGGGLSHNNSSNCTICHLHSDNFTANCDDCHNSSTDYDIDAHGKHAYGLYQYSCSTCHLNYGMGGSLEPVHPSGGAANISFDPDGPATRNGLDSNTPSIASGTCSNIYCHSNGRTAYRGTDGIYTWSGTIGPQTATYYNINWTSGSITACTSCHSGAGNMASLYTITSPFVAVNPPATGSHATNPHRDNDQSFSVFGWASVQCFWCHNANGASADGANLQGTYGTSLHVDGQTHFDPRQYVNGGTFANGMTYSYEGTAAHCGSGRKCW